MAMLHPTTGVTRLNWWALALLMLAAACAPAAPRPTSGSAPAGQPAAGPAAAAPARPAGSNPGRFTVVLVSPLTNHNPYSQSGGEITIAWMSVFHGLARIT